MNLNNNQLDDLYVIERTFIIASGAILRKANVTNPIREKVIDALNRVKSLMLPSSLLTHKGNKEFYSKELSYIVEKALELSIILKDSYYGNASDGIFNFIKTELSSVPNTDLDFNTLSFDAIDPLYHTPKAYMSFKNGYGIEVIRSVDQNEFHVNVIHGGQPCFQTAIAKDTLWYQTRNEVTLLMRRIRSL